MEATTQTERLRFLKDFDSLQKVDKEKTRCNPGNGNHFSESLDT